MAQANDRLRRRLADELGECCDEDVQRRRAELDDLAAAAFDDETRAVFAALGNDTRYRLARALATADGELCVCELEVLVDVSESAVSHALSDLVDAGVAARRKDGNWRYYDATALATRVLDAAETGVNDE